VREADLAPRHLIAPLFVKEGIADPAPIPSMPGQAQHTVESLAKEAREIAARGIVAFVLFGIPERKDPEGSEAWDTDGIAQRGARRRARADR
jgi:porphobilinogen synthase